MPNAVPQCTHVKTNGEVCGSPAVSGTDLCYHHSTVKAALAKGRPNGKVHSGGFAPIPFIFPEDRASMQINFFLLLQAYNEQRIDQRTYNSMLSMLKAMAKNLGKTGSLVEPSKEAVSKEAVSKKAVSKKAASEAETEEEDPFADLHGLPQEQYNALTNCWTIAPPRNRKKPQRTARADPIISPTHSRFSNCHRSLEFTRAANLARAVFVLSI